MIPTPTNLGPGEGTPLLLSASALKGITLYMYTIAFLSAIGGFLFGYDTGIISGSMIYIRDVFDLNEWWQEAVVSSTLLAAWIFSILSGSLNDRFGRKPVIVSSSFIFIVGSLVLAFALDEMMLLTGRLIVGAGVGLASMTVPMYLAEVAPSSIRGQLVMVNMCCITGGQFIASVLAYWFSFVEGGHGWRYMLGFAAIPATIQFFAFIPMPESPRWLVAKGRDEEAKWVLRKMRPRGTDIDEEFDAIKESDSDARHERQQLSDPNQSTFKRILASPPVQRALVVGCLLQAVQQVSGINTVMYYSASIFEMSGIHSKQKAILLSAVTALVNFVFTLLGYLLVERLGRRKLTLFSLFGVIVSLTILASSFQIATHNSPQVNQVNKDELNGPCYQYNDCSSCSQEPQCGFCFTPQNSSFFSDVPNTGVGLAPQIVNLTALAGEMLSPFTKDQPVATCLHVNVSHHDRSQIGQCSSGSQDKLVWAYEWCPSSYGWLTLLGMMLYLMFFAPGMGPMPWTLNSEIYPSWARSWCLSAATSVNWLFNLLMSMTFLSLTRAITKFGAFYLYASVSTLGFIYFLFVLPETKGKSLEDLETLFMRKHDRQRRASTRSARSASKLVA